MTSQQAQTIVPQLIAGGYSIGVQVVNGDWIIEVSSNADINVADAAAFVAAAGVTGTIQQARLK